MADENYVDEKEDLVSKILNKVPSSVTPENYPDNLYNKFLSYFSENDIFYLFDYGTITLNIEAVNDKPVATAQTVEATEQTEKTITLAGTDPDEDDLSYIVISLPENGVLKDDGTEITADQLPKTISSSDLSYTSNSDTATSDSFTFKVNDGTVDSDETATVTINITAVNDAPVATAQTVEATEQTEKTITLAGTDPDEDDLSYIVISLPENGVLKDDGTEITADQLPKTISSSDLSYTSNSTLLQVIALHLE